MPKAYSRELILTFSKPNKKAKVKTVVKTKKKKSVTVRDQNHRLLSCYVDKHVLHNVKIEAAKLNMTTTDFIRFIVDQALEDDKLKPPMNEL